MEVYLALELFDVRDKVIHSLVITSKNTTSSNGNFHRSASGLGLEAVWSVLVFMSLIYYCRPNFDSEVHI